MNAVMKIDLAHIDELARRLSSLVPTGLRGGATGELREELQQNFKSVLQTGLGKLDLVTRDEFDVQRAVLLRTRDKLNELQRAIEKIEAARGDSAAPNPPQH
jgi:ubiquinone biosynthesis accessory factor UbiK